jgi:hypothetical protein
LPLHSPRAISSSALRREVEIQTESRAVIGEGAMDRLKEYFSFAVWFAGLGYLPLWPLTLNGPGGDLFGASLLCDGAPSAPFVWLDWLCSAPHPFTLSPALHVLGAASACFVCLCLICRGVRRLRRRRRVAAVSVRIPESLLSPTRPPRSPPLVLPRAIKPRAHFGLRGIDRAADLQDMA